MKIYSEKYKSIFGDDLPLYKILQSRRKVRSNKSVDLHPNTNKVFVLFHPKLLTMDFSTVLEGKINNALDYLDDVDMKCIYQEIILDWLLLPDLNYQNDSIELRFSSEFKYCIVINDNIGINGYTNFSKLIQNRCVITGSPYQIIVIDDSLNQTYELFISNVEKTKVRLSNIIRYPITDKDDTLIKYVFNNKFTQLVRVTLDDTVNLIGDTKYPFIEPIGVNDINHFVIKLSHSLCYPVLEPNSKSWDYLQIIGIGNLSNLYCRFDSVENTGIINVKFKYINGFIIMEVVDKNISILVTSEGMDHIIFKDIVTRARYNRSLFVLN